MSIDYLEDLENDITNGKRMYACPGTTSNEWFISNSLEDLRKKAQRSADATKFQIHIYRLINKMETMSGDAYLLVRKILEPGPRGEPHFHWSVIDTREAADMMRDVSQGPTPYFGAVIEETFEPRS